MNGESKKTKTKSICLGVLQVFVGIGAVPAGIIELALGLMLRKNARGGG